MSWFLAYGLTNSLVALPLAALAILVGHYSRRPALVHLLWIAVLVKLITPSLFSVPTGLEISSATWQVDTVSDAAEGHERSSARPASIPLREPAPPGVSKREAAESPASAPLIAPHRRLERRATVPASQLPSVSVSTLLAIFSGLWVFGALLVAARAGYAGWRFQRALKRYGQSDAWLCARLTNVMKQAGLESGPAIVVIDGIFSPMLWGVGRRAKLVFPRELAVRLDREACDTLLLHELAHFSRGDHWVRLLELMCQIAFWWNPLVWLARRGIEASEELCCDAWVVARQQGSPRSYAEALLATIDFLNEESPCLPPIASGLGEISLLRRRLTRIMLGDPTTGLSQVARLAVITAIVAVAPVGPALLASSSQSPRSPVTSLKPDLPVPLTAQKRLSRATAAAEPQSMAVDSSDLAWPQVAPGPVQLRTPAEHWATALSPSGKYQFEARGGLKTSLVDVANRQWNVDFTSNRVTSVSFASDDGFATGQEGDFQVRVWDAAGGFLGKLDGAQAAITSVACSPTSNQVAAGSADGRVLVWDAGSREQIAQLETGAAVSCVRWSPDGSQLAISSSAWNHQAAGARVLIWSPAEARPAAEYSLDRPVSALIWPREAILAAVAWDGAGLTWNIATGEVRSQFSMGKDLPSAAAWSPDCPPVKRWIEGELAGSPLKPIERPER